MNWSLAVDFGTSNTAAAVQRSGERPKPLRLDADGDQMPSAVLVRDREITIGTAAVRAMRVYPSCFERSPKRLVGQRSVALGDAEIEIEEIVAKVLAGVRGRALRHFNNTEPARLILTHPEQWAKTKRRALVTAATRAGFDPARIATVSEPIAAVSWYAPQLAPGSTVAVFDFGGGTLDVAVLRRVDDPDDPWTVLASDGIDPLGGDLVDQRLLSAVFERLQLRGEDEIVSLLRNPAHRGAVLTLREQIRAAKQDLSENAQAEIPIVVADRTVVVSLTADELDEIVRDDVAAGIALMRATLQRARVDPADLHALYLTGGSSLLRAVHEGIRGLLGNRPATLEDPKLVVAMGAHLAVSPVGEPVSQQGEVSVETAEAAAAQSGGEASAEPAAVTAVPPAPQVPQWNPLPPQHPGAAQQPSMPSWFPRPAEGPVAVSPSTSGAATGAGTTPVPRAPVFGTRSARPTTTDEPTDPEQAAPAETPFGGSPIDTVRARTSPEISEQVEDGTHPQPEPARPPKAPTWATTAAVGSTRPTAAVGSTRPTTGEVTDSTPADPSPPGADAPGPAATTTPRSGELSAAASRMLELHPDLAAALDEHPEGRAVIDDEACLVALMTVPGLLQQVSSSVAMTPSRQVPSVYTVGPQGTYDIPLPIKTFFPEGAPWLPRDPGVWLADPVKRQPALWALSVIRTWCTANEVERRRILTEPAWDQWLAASLPPSILPLQNGFQVAVGYTPAEPPAALPPDYGLCVRPTSVTAMQRPLAAAFEPYYRLVEAGRLTGRRGAGVVIECLGRPAVQFAMQYRQQATMPQFGQQFPISTNRGYPPPGSPPAAAPQGQQLTSLMLYPSAPGRPPAVVLSDPAVHPGWQGGPVVLTPDVVAGVTSGMRFSGIPFSRLAIMTTNRAGATCPPPGIEITLVPQERGVNPAWIATQVQSTLWGGR